MNVNKSHILLHFVILIWGFTGILGKLISIPSESIVWYRMLIAFVSLGAYLQFRKKSMVVTNAQLVNYVLTGMVVALHWVLFFEAIKVSNVSVTLATLASATLFTSIIEPLFFRKRVIPYELLFGLLVIIGLGMIFTFETAYTLGILYALGSAFCASLFTTINGKFIENKGNATSITLYEMMGGVVGVSAYFLLTSQWEMFAQIPLALDWAYLLILGILCTAFAFVASVEVMKELSPYTVSISINMEPIYAILLALFFFGEEERMTPQFYLGAFLIMSTIFANGWLKKRMKSKVS